MASGQHFRIPFGTSLLFLPLIVILSSCDSTIPVVDSNGLIPRTHSVQFSQFSASFTRANTLALDIANGTPQIDGKTTSIDDANVQKAYTQMARDGFELADANCNDFFHSAGNNQKWAIFARDVIAAAGTLATAAAAASSASSGVTTGFSIATATGYNGLDIYQRDFLFGADNIAAVETMVQNALDVNTQTTFSDSRHWFGFGEVVGAIMSHQDICSPAYILLLTRTAIRNATVVPTGDNGTHISSVTIAPSGPSIPAPTSQPPPSSGGIPTLSNGLKTDNIPGVATHLPDNIASRRNALLLYVASVAKQEIKSNPTTLGPSSELSAIAKALGCSPDTNPNIQWRIIRETILAKVNGPQAADNMNTISNQLSQANIKSTF